MKMLVITAAGMLIASTAAFAQQPSAGRAELMTSIPSSSQTVTDWYKRIYDPNQQKIGEIMDVLVNPSGQIDAQSSVSADS
jgi:hypothetical protein